ncbi:agglutinin [Elysia marginata]|uniref:Agglutinin n=1 Tax=Elysia marginata TaxID=1093978 RepID=A0AAV4GNT4_9GAST|nr:agglutinin [Elysia marginata]
MFPIGKTKAFASRPVICLEFYKEVKYVPQPTSRPLPWSRVVLKQQPSHAVEHLTKALSLRCALEDTNPATSGAVPISPDTALLTVGAETDQYADEIVSIEFSRNGERLAFLEPNGYPQATGDWKNMKVIGDLSLPLVNSDHERAFLELIWSPPSLNQSGEYTCTVNTTSASNKSIYEVTSEVGIQFPSKQDLVSQMRILHQEDLANQEKLSDLQAAASVLKPAHAESGVVSCGDSTGWNSYIGSRRYVYKDVKFRRPYTGKSPIISLGIKGIDSYHSKNLRMQLDVVNRSTSGFRVRCGTWGDTRIYSLTVRWTSAVA